MARTYALYTTATPSSAQLETEWGANWRGDYDPTGGPWLYLWVKPDSYPAAVRVFVRSDLGDELDASAPVWASVPDGPETVATPSPSDGWTLYRYQIGSGISGVVVSSNVAGSCQLSAGQS